MGSGHPGFVRDRVCPVVEEGVRDGEEESTGATS